MTLNSSASPSAIRAKRLPKAMASIRYWIALVIGLYAVDMPMYAASKSPTCASSSAVPWKATRPPLRST